jgi:hypothetical protein
MEVIADTEKSNGQVRLNETYAQAAEALKRLDERARSFIRERPAVALLGAMALGFIVARVARRLER